MSKLTYPSDGISKYGSNYLKMCEQNLKVSQSNCNFNIPSNFIDRNYLYSLRDEIGKHTNETTKMISSLDRITYNYELLSNELSSSAKKITILKIKPRDRMIL